MKGIIKPGLGTCKISRYIVLASSVIFKILAI